MSGQALKGKRVTRDEGIVVAQKVLLWVLPEAEKAMICGSIRRNRDSVGDVDIVVIPEDLVKFNQIMAERWGWTKGDKTKANRRGLVDEVQVEIYLATREDWGAQILMWTGSAGFNIYTRGLAKGKGMALNQYGLFKGERKIAGGIEEEIFEKLGIKYLTPAERQMEIGAKEANYTGISQEDIERVIWD